MNIKRIAILGCFTLGLIVLASAFTPSATAGPSQKTIDIMRGRKSGYEAYYFRRFNLPILRFAQGKVGQQVGDGECWTLADQALRATGAKPAEGYTFGKVVSSRDVRPGDIVQFTSARFETANSWSEMGAPNHTAIVETKNGNVIGLLQQNTNGNRTVSRQELDLSTKVRGTVQFFRAVGK